MRIPVDLIAGWKGAGKTSLIDRMERHLWMEERLTILLNENGREWLGTSLRPGHQAVYWTQGCICCTANALLEQELLRLAQEGAVQRLLVELSELSRLTDVKIMLSQMKEFQLEHVLYVLDASQLRKKWETSGPFLAKQLPEAAEILINRMERLNRVEQDWVYQTLREEVPRVPISEFSVETITAKGLQALYERGRLYRKIGFGPKQKQGGI